MLAATAPADSGTTKVTASNIPGGGMERPWVGWVLGWGAGVGGNRIPERTPLKESQGRLLRLPYEFPGHSVRGLITVPSPCYGDSGAGRREVEVS